VRRTRRRLQTASMGLLRAFFSIAHTPTTMLGSVLGWPSSSASPGACVQSAADRAADTRL